MLQNNQINPLNLLWLGFNLQFLRGGEFVHSWLKTKHSSQQNYNASFLLLVANNLLKCKGITIDISYKNLTFEGSTMY